MKVLITGADGQLGRALQAERAADADLILTDLATLDIADAAAVQAFVARTAPDVIINAAAYTAVDRAEADAEACAAVNARAPGLLAAAAAAVGARMAHVSTDFVFDGRKGAPYAPGDAVNPLSVYGRTKAQGEAAVRAALPGALIVRTAWLYAADGANFVRTMLRVMGGQGGVRVVSDQIGTPTAARTLAAALWGLIAQEAEGTLHVTDAGAASWYDFAVAIAEEGHARGLLPAPAQVTPILTADYPTPAVRPTFSVLDKSATWALLGAPAPHWRASLRRVLDEIAAAP